MDYVSCCAEIKYLLLESNQQLIWLLVVETSFTTLIHTHTHCYSPLPSPQLPAVVGCDGERCVRCVKGLQADTCEDCSVVLIDPVTEFEYEINGETARCTVP